jgi:crotonobetainyl-CoA:carnitine CoA-transferase CaiB-like acyl-CoA transferase
MQKELQEYYENRFSMMSTQGWVDLIEDVDIMITATNTLAGVDNEQQLQFKKGEMSILNWLKNLRIASSEVYDQLQKEESDDA